VLALILLIAAVVVIGGGIEVARRVRFGSGSAAAHHRVLDTLGHLTTQGGEAGAELSAHESTLSPHVRLVVDADPTQPRITPQPMSRPVGVVPTPAATGGVASGEAPGRGPGTEVSGVRLLGPEPDAEAGEHRTPADTGDPDDAGERAEPDTGGAADTGERGWEAPAVARVAPPVRVDSVGRDDGLHEAEGFRVLAPPTVDRAADTAGPTPVDAAAAGARWGAGGPRTQTAERTRAQLAALARSGGVGPIAAGAPRGHHGRRRAMTGRGRRPATVAAAVVLVLAVAGGVAVVGLPGGSRPRSHPAASPPLRGPAVVPTTSLPPAQPASLLTKTATTATYAVVGSPTISLTGSAPCWLQVRQDNQSGSVLFEGTLSSGQQKNLTRPVWVRLGNPAAISVQINGSTLDPPTQVAGSPYNLQFQ